MPASAPDIQSLLHAAHADGDLSLAALEAIELQADIGQQIQAGLGVAPEDVPASQVLLVTMMPDDSGSIRFAGNADAVREGHNQVLDALTASRQRDDVLTHTRYLNGHVLFPYVSLPQAKRMNTGNYNPSLGTPLYDQTAVLLATVLVKVRQMEDAGVPARSITLLITDGADEGSQRQDAASVRLLVEDMRRKEAHIVAAMGIADGHTDFWRVFRAMGIPDEWILTPGSSAPEIRRAFQVFSQSAVRASQGASPRMAAGGFSA